MLPGSMWELIPIGWLCLRIGMKIRYAVFTSDLIALCEWLKRCQIQTIAMESTGVYWIPLFQMLERNGFGVCLVNASHAKNVPGRKTEVKDCQWLQELHTFGMLRGSFRPEAQMC